MSLVGSVKMPNLQNNYLMLPTEHLPKAFILLGSLAIGQWVLTDFVELPGGFVGLLAVGSLIYWFKF